MAQLEIEAKYPITNLEGFMGVLQALWLNNPESIQVQKDQYYNPPHKDFTDEEIISEWLRVREGDTTSINFKVWLPVGEKVQTHCEEHETPVENGDTMKWLLEALGYRKLAYIDKTRKSYQYGELKICVDSVVWLGDFVEFERVMSERDIDEVVESIDTLSDKFSAFLWPRDRRGYPYHVLEKAGEG